MEIAINKYNSGDLVILNDPKYKSAFGEFPYLASVEYSDTGFGIRNHYEDKAEFEGERLLLSNGGFRYPEKFELLKRYAVVVPFDTDYTTRKHSISKLFVVESSLVPFFYQRDITIYDKRNPDNSYTIYKIDVKLHENRGRKLIRTGINFLAKNTETGITKSIPYTELITHFDL